MSSKTIQGDRLSTGDTFPDLRLTAIDGATIAVPADDGRLTHVQFRRFAGCPFCNLHLRSVVARIDEIEAAGVREVVLFHSTAEELRTYQADMPFAVVADPDRELYHRFGVEHGARAVLNLGALRAIPAGVLDALRKVRTRRRAPLPLLPNGGNLGLPADVLVASDGTVVAAMYGHHAYDQWTVDELLAHAATAAATA